MGDSQRDLRVVVADDEAPARDLLGEYLAALPGCRLVASCADGFEAVRAVSELQPDLLVLDIQMPELDGFDVVDLLESPPAIIFATAYEEHAVRAFDVAAVDYLLKPFSADRLRQAVERARQRMERGESQGLERLLTQLRAGEGSGRILVRDGSKIHVIAAEDLDYAESSDDYIQLHASGKRLRKKQTLNRLAEQLDSRRFIRVHRCFLINLDRIDRIEPYSRESRVAILADGTRIPVSRTGYARLRERL